ncbi:uncharacterized protein LAESUDRAFT_477973 [Laetiporus sulphureus 93-53]|uniref:Uncharacterized protein n=1 Tax=Laetiporus sulphureus 93-53 TaxID=1314785 RepID=A0A165BQG2_9APHY|nr:uncharacterized protein LAESUDRAFT_477973 [Laetiporus sulphureus 93-53]KZT01466.1 hypothetical protein LAESUDRAFT_477973 [Laetiporus sulphureus 93-53]
MCRKYCATIIALIGLISTDRRRAKRDIRACSKAITISYLNYARISYYYLDVMKKYDRTEPKKSHVHIKSGFIHARALPRVDPLNSQKVRPSV